MSRMTVVVPDTWCPEAILMRRILPCNLSRSGIATASGQGRGRMWTPSRGGHRRRIRRRTPLRPDCARPRWPWWTATTARWSLDGAEVMLKPPAPSRAPAPRRLAWTSAAGERRRSHDGRYQSARTSSVIIQPSTRTPPATPDVRNVIAPMEPPEIIRCREHLCDSWRHGQIRRYACGNRFGGSDD